MLSLWKNSVASQQLSSTHLTPMEAMTGWRPNHLVVRDASVETFTMSDWVDRMSARCAHIRDIIEDGLSSTDFLEEQAECPFSPGDCVPLERPPR